MIKKLKQWQRNKQQRNARAAVEPTIYPRESHGVSRKDMPTSVLKVLNRLHRSGHSAYLVGGCVRDLLAGVRPKDFDVATDAHPEQVRKLFRNSMIIGRRFKLVHVRFGREIIEVVTFRGEGSDFAKDSRRKHSQSGMILRDNVYGDMRSDVWRRDFTINALYYNIADSSIVDYVGGMADIKSKKVRMIGDAAMRYQEDPARMLRALRVAAKLDFTVDAETLAPLNHLVENLAHVSTDRLFVEVMKVFYGGGGHAAFPLLQQYGIFDMLFPRIAQCIDPNDKDDSTQHMISQALYNADKRYAKGQSLSAAFLFAALLWQPLQHALTEAKQKHPKMAFMHRFNECADSVLADQNKTIAIPKRIAENVRAIWEQQYRMAQRSYNDPIQVVQHQRFRASYDLVVLRAQSGEPVSELAIWWERFQNASAREQKAMVAELPPPRDRRQPSGRRKRRD